MSPTYSLTLVLAVTLFLTATSLADDRRKYPLTGDVKSQSNHQPSTTLENELRNPMPRKGGGGNEGNVHVNWHDRETKTKKKPGHGHDGQLRVNEGALDKKPIHKPVGPHDPHVNEEELIYKPKPKPGRTDVFEDGAKDKRKDKPGPHQVDVETAKVKGKEKPRTGS